MEERLLLWLYVISAGSLAALFLRRPGPDRWYVGVVLLIGVVSAAGLAFPEAQRHAFLAGTAGFVLFMLLPGLLVRVARRGVVRGRFAGAQAMLRIAAALLPSDALRRERDLYRAIHRDGGAEHPAARELRERLGARPGEGRARVCGALAVVLLVAYVAVTLAGDTESHLTLMEFGANHGPLVKDGQVYRLFTAMLLHMGLLHLGMNAVAIWLLGRWVEPRLGTARTLAVFFLAGLVGNCVSVLVYGASGVSSVGASGAAMGLVGAATADRLRRDGDAHRRRQLTALLLVIGATLFLGFVEPFIDNGAHIGGLGAGFLLGVLFLHVSRPPDLVARVAAAVLVAAALVSVGWMLRDLESWREEVPVEGSGFTFSRPAFLVPVEEGPVWAFVGVAAGDLTVCVQPAVEDPEAFLAQRLEEIAAEGRKHASRPRVEVRGPRRLEGPGGPDLAGHVLVTADRGAERTDVFVFLEPDSPRIAVLTISLPEPDPVLRRRTVPVVLESFRFR
ncbi:MAG: rhomboid family intramembrane serine protease [Planctomycetota bacterium]|jgi:rhomboid protease GluP